MSWLKKEQFWQRKHTALVVERDGGRRQMFHAAHTERCGVCWMAKNLQRDKHWKVQRWHPGLRKLTKRWTNELKRPSEPGSPLPERIRTHMPEPVVLDGEEFVKSLRSSRRGAAPGPSGMCAEHLRPLRDRETDVMGTHQVRQHFCQGTNSFRDCGSCPVGSHDRAPKAKRWSTRHRRG